MSRPAGARGLKHWIQAPDEKFKQVAPRRGAWIETFLN